MRNKSLKKILDFLIVLFIFITIIFTYLDMKNITQTLKEMQREKIALIIKNNLSVLNKLLKYGFYDELNSEIRNIVNISNEITGLEIITLKKKFSYFEKEKKENVYIYNTRNVTFKIYYDSHKILKSFFNKYFNRFLIYVLLFSPFVIFIFIYLRNKINKFNILAAKLEKLDFRKVKQIKKIDNFYEIVNIVNAINSLLKRADSFYKMQIQMIRKMIKLKKHLESAQRIAQSFSWEYDCINNNIQISNEFKKFLNAKKNEFTLSEFNKFFPDIDVSYYLNNICKKCLEFETIHILNTLKNKQFNFKTIGKCIKTKKSHYVLCVSLNITESVEKQKMIEFLAYHDPLTGLPNRRKLIEKFEFLASLAKRENKKISLLYLDMDNFKMINDTLGHNSGDEFLKNIARRLKESIRSTDFVARIGGDEFVVLLYDINSKQEAKKVIKKITEVLNKSVNIKNNNIIATFSIGGAIYPDDAENFENLLKYADIAMYEIKEKGKNNYAFIDENIKKYSSDFYKTVDELKKALKNNELVLYFQPKIDIRDNKVYGAEGLIRWNHPERGILSPFHFIPFAEKSGLISKIDEYVLNLAFKTLKKWQNDEKLKHLSLAINISANKFKEEDFVENLKNLLNKHKINPSKLEIEITETLSMDNVEYTISILKQLKFLGFKIALDDFGTGYSSLNYLKTIPFDTLKVDQSFVMDLENDRDDLVITKMIVQIAKVLNKNTVAEGVENEKILNIVKNLGCNLVQGYYFAKPMNEKSFIEFCKNFPHK